LDVDHPYPYDAIMCPQGYTVAYKQITFNETSHDAAILIQQDSGTTLQNRHLISQFDIQNSYGTQKLTKQVAPNQFLDYIDSHALNPGVYTVVAFTMSGKISTPTILEIINSSTTAGLSSSAPTLTTQSNIPGTSPPTFPQLSMISSIGSQSSLFAVLGTVGAIALILRHRSWRPSNNLGLSITIGFLIFTAILPAITSSQALAEDYTQASQGIEAHNTTSTFTSATTEFDFYGAQVPEQTDQGFSVQNNQFTNGFTEGTTFLWSQSVIQFEIPSGTGATAQTCSTQGGSYTCEMPKSIEIRGAPQLWTATSNGACPTGWTNNGDGTCYELFLGTWWGIGWSSLQHFDLYVYQQINSDGSITLNEKYRTCDSTCSIFTTIETASTEVVGQPGNFYYYLGNNEHQYPVWGVQALVAECGTCSFFANFKAGTYATATYTINSSGNGVFRPAGTAYSPTEQNENLCWWPTISSTGGSNPTFSTSARYNNSTTPCHEGSHFPDPGIQINAYDQSGNSLSGLQVSAYDSSNNLLQQGYTPLYVPVATGGTYYVDFDNYNNHLTSIGDYPSVTSYSINTSWGGQATVNVPSSGNVTVNGYYATNSGTSNNLKVTSADMNDNSLTGFYMQLGQGGTQINQGYTPVTFSSLSGSGTAYVVYANSYCNPTTLTNYAFTRWGDGTTTSGDTVNLYYDTSIKAYYTVTSVSHC
jgi:hypothetical protein